MTTKIIQHRQATALRKRIKRFYEHLNYEDGDKCYRAIDPRIRKKPTSVTLFQYLSSLKRFLGWSGGVLVHRIEPIRLHLNERNRLYENRDFALAEVHWEDQYGHMHTFREKWVREPNGRWYTRSTGFVVPETT